jgi:hypothetical protein
MVYNTFSCPFNVSQYRDVVAFRFENNVLDNHRLFIDPRRRILRIVAVVLLTLGVGVLDACRIYIKRINGSLGFVEEDITLGTVCYLSSHRKETRNSGT